MCQDSRGVVCNLQVKYFLIKDMAPIHLTLPRLSADHAVLTANEDLCHELACDCCRSFDRSSCSLSALSLSLSKDCVDPGVNSRLGRYASYPCVPLRSVYDNGKEISSSKHSKPSEAQLRLMFPCPKCTGLWSKEDRSRISTSCTKSTDLDWNEPVRQLRSTASATEHPIRNSRSAESREGSHDRGVLMQGSEPAGLDLWPLPCFSLLISSTSGDVSCAECHCC